MKINYPETIILKSDGENASEKYLHDLCNQTFLSLWSYPNLFRDQGKMGCKGDGKELCDLLVVFEKHIIIFSDKMCEFPKSDDVRLNWSRWYKKTIKEAAQQIFGAERWIRKYNNHIFLDKQCQHKFPINFPNDKELVFHRIVVAHGASSACKQYFNGGSGSLILDNTIQNAQHWSLSNNDVEPFHIGKVDSLRGFVHVFDDVSLGVVMQTLDTVSDFIGYLDCKEKLLQERDVIAVGEEELLAQYLMNTDKQGNHYFVIDKPNTKANLYFAEGSWREFCKHPSRLAQINENADSYLWDRLIEKFLFHISTGTAETMSPPVISEQEALFRIMARENRTNRRALADALLGLIEKTPSDSRSTRIFYSSASTTYYLFFLLPCPAGHSHEEYRSIRKTLLHEYVYIVKSQIPDALDIVGIALETQAPYSEHLSEDVIYLDARYWTDEDQKQAERVEQEFIENGFLGSRNYYHKTIYEYPQTQEKKFKGRDRNKICPCGSGKKYKRCCGA